MNITIDIGWLRRSRHRAPVLVGREVGIRGSIMRGTLLDPIIRPGSRSTLSSRFPGIAKYIRRRYGIGRPLYLLQTVHIAGNPNPQPSNQWIFRGYGLDVTVNDVLKRPVLRSTPRLRAMQAAAKGRQPASFGAASGSGGGRTP